MDGQIDSPEFQRSFNNLMPDALQHPFCLRDHEKGSSYMGILKSPKLIFFETSKQI